MRKVLLIFAFVASINADVFDKAKDINNNARLSQEKIDKLDEKRQSHLEEYNQVLKEIKSTKSYNEQLKRVIASQESEMRSLEIEIASIDDTARSLLPLINRMVLQLEKLIELDLPFLPEERKARVERLKDLIDRADVSISEKYRATLEAYLIENEYSKTIEAYLGEADGKEVEFFRFGRIGLFYLTLDRKNAFMYDKDAKQFVEIKSRDELEKAINIAKKDSLPDFITLPIKSPR